MGSSTKARTKDRAMEKRLDRASKRLLCLEEMKSRLEKIVERYLSEITCIDHRIDESEAEIERLVQEQAVRECQNRIRDEINKLKEEKRHAEMCVKTFKKELCIKMRRLEKCRKHLPEYRKHKCLENNNAALFSDYAYLREDVDGDTAGCTFAIEIKPKQGFRSPGAESCPFCYKQREKLKLGKIHRITQYCPIDLFSGDEKRMKSAISNLLENPQNNLQLFKEGNLRFGEKMGARAHLGTYLQELFDVEFPQHDLLDNFVDLIKRALTHKFPTRNVHSSHTFPQKLETSNLPSDCVLQRILALQRYDPTGRIFEFNPGAYDYVEQLLRGVGSRGCVRCVISDHVEQRDGGDVQAIGGCAREKCNRNDPIMPEKEIDGKMLTMQQKFAVAVPHYVAKIAKDCSLMITLKKLKMKKGVNEVAEHHLIRAKYGVFVVDVKVLDLYPKPQK